MNLPNKITVGRFVLSVVYFTLLALMGGPAPADASPGAVSPAWLWDVAFLLFLIGALSDIVDGYLARRWNIVTDFGRVTDPFVDKIIVCGSFVFFLKIPALEGVLPAWMVVVILAREFLVSGLRSLLEAKGLPFPANWWGKQKMVVQSVVVCVILFTLGHWMDRTWSMGVLQALIWVALVSTVASGVTYLYEARALFRAKDI
ncbi:MAG: CDP-diacylglycerol--glycerol-3-phosphate 3-phosphatidyltransferase [Planctomycetes bacterium]|nr:CDP-diacylglycerol--glycerol-3-phosphate 3-phosphatidyltransferase [Planctomycetota bacterium]